MEPSKVYFTDMRARPGMPLQKKLEKLLRAAGLPTIDFQDKYAAIKIHFGEPGNLSFLRPNWAKTVADLVKELGGKPFLTDCNTLYVGRRKNALDHLDAAYENGFSPLSTGCQIIIAEGLKAVSYTHLDVYKRQVRTPRPRCRGYSARRRCGISARSPSNSPPRGKNPC